MMRELLYRDVNEKAFSGGIRKRLFFYRISEHDPSSG